LYVPPFLISNELDVILTSTDIILSLVRTSRVGYLRDIRRLTVALSRARLGLYVLGRREVFESCFELRQAFELLLKRPDKLKLVTGELYPSERLLAEEADKKIPGEATMENVEHIGQYVYEMTSTKVEELRRAKGITGPVIVGEVEEEAVGGGEDEMQDEAEEGSREEEEEEEERVRVEGFEAEEEQ
jgi:intron-binding protein aquarius